MAVIKLTFVVPNIEDVLESYDQIKVYRSTAGEDGTYLEITDASTRITLEAGKTQYEYTDSVGSVDYWYSNSFFLSVAPFTESSRSDPVQGESDPALSILSVEQLQTRYLWGVDTKDEDGNEIPYEAYAFYIRSAVSWVSRATDLPLEPKIFTEAVPERLDFIRQDYYKYMRLQMDEYPIQSVESIKMVLPTEQEVISFDPSWWQIQDFSGQIEIIPGRGTMSVVTLGQTGAWLPVVYGWTDYVPQVFRIAYTAGFPNNEVPAEIVDVVGKVASIGILNVAGDLVVGAGIASRTVALDGIMSRVDTTQSAQYAGYSARIYQYWREVHDTIPTLKAYYKGTPMVVA